MGSVRVDQLEREGLVEVTWLPYELHPEVPPEGLDRGALAPAAYWERAHRAVRTMAAEVGLELRTSPRLINSRRALAAAEFARERDAFTAMHGALFRAHWEQTARIDDVGDLCRLATVIGLDGEDLARALGEDRYGPTIDEHRRTATAAGIDAIPAHVLGRRFMLLGAQPLDTFRAAIAELRSAGT